MSRTPIITALIAVPLAVAAALPALSSSEDAWAEFRTAVEAECGKLVEAPADATTAIEVNPFGSESYGAALVTVTLKDGSADRMICVYDKQAKTAELTAPFEAGSYWEKGRQMPPFTVNATAAVGLTVAVSYWLSLLRHGHPRHRAPQKVCQVAAFRFRRASSFAAASLRSLYLSVRAAERSRVSSVNFTNSSITSTMRS